MKTKNKESIRQRQGTEAKEREGAEKKTLKIEPSSPGGGQDPKGNAISCNASASDDFPEEGGDAEFGNPSCFDENDHYLQQWVPNRRSRLNRECDKGTKSVNEVGLIDNPGPGGGQTSKGSSVNLNLPGMDESTKSNSDEMNDPPPAGGSYPVGSPEHIQPLYLANLLSSKSKQIEPKNQVFDMAVVYRRERRFDMALECLERVLVDNPNHIPAQAELGKISLLRGNLVQSRLQFQRVLTQDPGDPYANRGLGAIAAASSCGAWGGQG